MMDPMVPLALSVQSNKGVYAVLLGSGVSRAAGIPTGWEIVLDLIRKVARLEGEDENCGADPAQWYREAYQTEPNYSDLLGRVAKTAPERSQLLRPYFEPTEEEREEGLKVPTDAHRALADLVARGYIRVVVTTNFDRLMEQALEAVGIRPTVVASADAIKGAMPLAHSQRTVVKLHGDYLDARILNTPEELARYAGSINRLLDQIFDEYGLIVCGWSADWDTALRGALERRRNRRFATYWTFIRTPRDAALRLIAHLRAEPLQINSADTFLQRLAESIVSLEDMARPHPLSARVAQATVKRLMVDDRQRIRLHDLVMDEANRIHGALTGEHALSVAPPFVPDELVSRLIRYEAMTEVLMAVMATAGYWGAETHRHLEPIPIAWPLVGWRVEASARRRRIVSKRRAPRRDAGLLG